MMQSGLIDDWRPKGGQLTIIRPSEVSRAAAIRARTDATPPSFQQDAYLEMARTAKLTGQRFDRLILCAFTLQGVPDIPALVRATTTIVRRHDVVFIPPGVRHSIRNNGLTDLRFIVVTTPVEDR